MSSPSSLMDAKEPRSFSAEEEEQKRLFYERMSPRRRKFIDKIGYEAWDPFEAPKEPLDIRTDVTQRTAQQLVSEFLKTSRQEHNTDYSRGVLLQCALGMINREEKYLAVFDFCLWYHDLLKKEQAGL